ncbi:MAG TPA: hypothetical protein VN840_10890 [Streptosporangiaceae bacterium]|nr:hypothetical protein [Streptosporangiaceae bacterium]
MIISSDQLTVGTSRASGRAAGRPGSVRWLTATAAVAAAVIAVAGCSAAKAPAGPGGSGGGSKPLTAHQAIRLAADASQRVNSLAATLSVQASGGPVGGLTGSMKIRVKPTLLLEADFSVAAAGSPRSEIGEILTSKAIYIKDTALTRVSGKPWIKIDFSQLTSRLGVSFSSLFQNLEGSNPLAQTRLFAVSKNVHSVGSGVVDGVPCTEYAGSYQPGAALSALSPQLRKLLGPMLRGMGAQAVQFDVWIDGQHLIRKAVSHETIGGQAVISTYVVTSINQPVSVTLPPASEIAPLPKI